MTANSKDAATAFASDALARVAEPVSAAALSMSILRARERVRKHRAALLELPRPPRPTRLAPETLAARPLFLIGERQRRLYPLDPQRIDYVRSDGNYVRYCVANVEYIARETGKRLEALLSPMGFLRIERSLLVNMRAIAYVEPVGHGTFGFTLTSGARLCSGPTYRESILTVLSLRRRSGTGSQGRAGQGRRPPAEPGEARGELGSQHGN
jgi:DNA-binding LytR/AlgR family response regulator